jgi:hypothetical protein
MLRALHYPLPAAALLQMLLYMARAYHDANQHMMAKACLIKALHLAPGSIKLHFDLAFVLQVCLLPARSASSVVGILLCAENGDYLTSMEQKISPQHKAKPPG